MINQIVLYMYKYIHTSTLPVVNQQRKLFSSFSTYVGTSETTHGMYTVDTYVVDFIVFLQSPLLVKSLNYKIYVDFHGLPKYVKDSTTAKIVE